MFGEKIDNLPSLGEPLFVALSGSSVNFGSLVAVGLVDSLIRSLARRAAKMRAATEIVRASSADRAAMHDELENQRPLLSEPRSRRLFTPWRMALLSAGTITALLFFMQRRIARHEPWDVLAQAVGFGVLVAMIVFLLAAQEQSRRRLLSKTLSKPSPFTTNSRRPFQQRLGDFVNRRGASPHQPLATDQPPQSRMPFSSTATLGSPTRQKTPDTIRQILHRIRRALRGPKDIP